MSCMDLLESGDDDLDERLKIRTRTVVFKKVDNELIEVTNAFEEKRYESRINVAETFFERSTPIELLYDPDDLSI